MKPLKPGERHPLPNGLFVQQRQDHWVVIDEAQHEYATGVKGFYEVPDEADDAKALQEFLERQAANAVEEARIDRQYQLRAMLDPPVFSHRSGFVFNSHTGEHVEAARPPKRGRIG